MNLLRPSKLWLLALGALAVEGHSWIDSVQVIGGGNGIAPASIGYVRNYQGHVDATSSYLVDDLGKPACAPFQQKVADYNNPQYPILTAPAGSQIVGDYLENGHVSFVPDVPGATSGEVYWFGTTDPAVAQMPLAEVIKWTADGKGGNGKGRLLAGPLPFDDGVCAEDNGSPVAVKRPKGPCKSTFRMPEDVKSGEDMTVLWVWDFSNHFGPEKKGHVEWYTSCLDVHVGSPAGNPKVPRNIRGTKRSGPAWRR